MTPISDNGWTLHYTIGCILAGKVMAGEVAHLPGDRGDRIVSGGRVPRRARYSGTVLVKNAADHWVETQEARPAALGMVWISAAGGWSELPS